MSNTFSQSEFYSYASEVTASVQQAVETCEGKIEALFALLPGLFPSQIIESLGQLGCHKSNRLAELLREGYPAVPRSIRHRILPHPLDFEWLFTPECARNLADEIGVKGSVLCVGTPSIFSNLLANGLSNAHLVDRDLVVDEFRSRYGSDVPVSSLSSMRDGPPLGFDAAILDGPWYPEETELFALTASRHLRKGGVLWVVGPSTLTRPGVESERLHLINTLQNNGIEFVKVQSSAARYETPPFEVATLNTLGLFGVPRQWRTADILSFISSTADPGNIQVPEHKQSEVWDEVSIGPARIKFQRVRSRPLDFELKSVTPGDVLCSVSRRDPLRKLVSVWTSGNRCFDCGDSYVLSTSLKAFQKGLSLPQEIHREHNLILGSQQNSELETSVKRITDLLTKEAQEVEWI